VAFNFHGADMGQVAAKTALIRGFLKPFSSSCLLCEYVPTTLFVKNKNQHHQQVMLMLVAI
jgi:hypothetical protein